MNESMKRFVSYAEEMGVTAAPNEVESLVRGAEWLARASRASGLSQYDTPEHALVRAMGPALSFLALDEPPSGGRMADLGAGNGAIGSTIALFQSDLEVFLVDRAKRAYTACEMLVARMGLSNAHPVHADATSLGQRYGAVVFRALARGADALEAARSITASDGLIGAYHSEGDAAFERPGVDVTVIGTRTTIVPELVLTVYRR